MRLASQNRVDLGAPVERYLPGVLRGTGGARIDGQEDHRPDTVAAG
ncbi:hypothetical protein [[Actinomadura] parvosata]